MSYPLCGQQPVTIWKSGYNAGINNIAGFRNMVLDNNGNSYLTGNIDGDQSQYDRDVATARINADGTVQWSDVYTSIMPSNSGDISTDIVMCPDQNPVITGILREDTIFAIKYSAATGQRLWTTKYRNPFGTGDSPVIDAEADANGNVYLIGSMREEGTAEFNMNLIKISSSGAIVYIKRINMPGGRDSSSQEYGNKVLCVNNDVYIFGNGTRTNANYNSIYASKINPSNGDALWTLWNPQDSAYAGAYSIYYNIPACVDNSGNLFFAGRVSQSGNTKQKLVVFRVNSANGLLSWKRIIDFDPTGFVEYAMELVPDNNGSLYMYSEAVIDGDIQYGNVITKLNASNGDSLWCRVALKGADGTSTTLFSRSAMIYDNGGVIVVGQQAGYGTMRRFESNGDSAWTKYPEGINTGNFEKRYTVLKNSTGEYMFAFGGHSFFAYVEAKVSVSALGVIHNSRKNLGKPINDNQNTWDTIRVTSDNSALYVADVNVTLDTVLHTNDSDLEISLIHAGTNDTVVYREGGAGDNFIGTILDDSAPTLLSNGSAPFTGSFKPSKPLIKFRNLNPDGTWMLKIYDRAAGNTGFLRAWSIQITYSATPVGIAPISAEIPEDYKLKQNYPNPFNPETNFEFQIPNSGLVTIKVYDIQGKEVRTPVSSQLKAGSYKVTFDGSGLNSGVYFYRLVSEGVVMTRKMILLK